MEFVGFTDWEDLPESADALFAKGAKDSIFLSRPWFENIAETALNDYQSVYLACVIDGETVLAILPLVSDASGNLDSLSNNFSNLYSVLVSDKKREAVLDCLARGLSRLPFQGMRLRPIDPDDGNMRLLQTLMQSSGFDCFRQFRFHNWVHRLDGQTFEGFMASRPSRVCNTIARKRRKLEREQGYRIRLFTRDDLQEAAADFHAAFKASWKRSEPLKGFVDGLIGHLSETGWLRLAVLYIKGQPAAAQFWMVAHGKASILRLAYDETWKPYSPGSILTEHLMERVIDTDKVEEIDFLMGDDPYKRDWMSERRERWAMSCVNRQAPKGWGALFLEALKGLLKGTTKRA